METISFSLRDIVTTILINFIRRLVVYSLDNIRTESQTMPRRNELDFICRVCYYLDGVHGVWRGGQRADDNIHKPTGKEISRVEHDGHLFDLLPTDRSHRQFLALVAGLVVDENRFVLLVHVLFVDGNRARRVDPHGRTVSNEVIIITS